MSTAPLLDPSRLAELRTLLVEEGVDGWLLFDFRDQNPPAHALLGLGKTTRRAFALYPREGDPILLHHAIEASAWRGWQWEKRTYSGWEELERKLDELLRGRGRLAAEISPGSAVPTVDRIPAGVAELIRRSGVELVSSATFISAFHSRWSAEELHLHRKAAGLLPAVARGAFELAARRAHGGDPMGEGELSEWIHAELRTRGISEGIGCSVAGGVNASDPHYHPEGAGAPIGVDTLLLVDLWGAFPGGVAADQTWMGFLGGEPTPRQRQVWEAVRDARNGALTFLRERWDAGNEVRGFEVDDVARGILRERGLDRWFVHRLGHSMDRELHGSGPNLDNLETRDDRRLLEGLGFSVEPGVYIPGELGLRTEVNVYWGPDGPEITGPTPQDELLLFPG